MLDQIAALVLVASVAGAVAYAALCDVTSYTIPNRVSLALVALFAVWAPMSGLGLSGLGWHAAAFAVVLFGAFGLFAAGWIGGGDAKLAAALSLWVGWTLLPAFLVVTALFGAALTLALIVGRSLPLPMALARVGWICRLHDPKAGVPYGVALACGALATLPRTGVWSGAFPG